MIGSLAIRPVVSAVILHFDDEKRDLSELLRDPFKTVSRISEHDQEVIRPRRDAVIVQNQMARVIGPVVRQTPASSIFRGVPRRAAYQE